MAATLPAPRSPSVAGRRSAAGWRSSGYCWSAPGWRTSGRCGSMADQRSARGSGRAAARAGVGCRPATPFPSLCWSSSVAGRSPAGRTATPCHDSQHAVRGGAAEFGEQFASRRPTGRILGQAPLDQWPDPVRHVPSRGGAVHDPVQQGGCRPRAERGLARRGERQHAAEAEDVGRRPDVMALGLLRGHEAG